MRSQIPVLLPGGQGGHAAFLAAFDMMLHQRFEGGKIFLFDQIHQTVMLFMGGAAAVFLLDCHGGETADILILSFDDAEDPVLAGDRSQRGMEVTGKG